MRTDRAAEDRQRRVDPFVLPRSSTSRFTLLVLIVAAASVFASYWLLILQQDSWRGANRTCLVRADAVAADPLASARILVACIHDVVVRQYLTTLAGPLALAGLTVAGLMVIPRLILIWLQTRGLRADEASTRDQLHAAVTVMGLRRTPEFLWAGRGGVDRADIRTVDGLGRPRIVIDKAAAPSAQTFRAMILHELAHLRNHDVRPTFVVLSAWCAYLAAVAVPLTVLALSRRSDVGFALAWRLTVITLLVYLVLMSALRTREHEADLRVVAVTGGEEITAALAASSAGPPQTRWRNRLHAPFRRHPLPDMRQRVLARPEAIMKTSGAEAFSTGVAAGLVITEAKLLVEYLAPVSPLTSCWITGLVCAAAILSVVGTSAWRATLAAAVLTDPPPRAWWAGWAVTAGLMAGIQLSPRSAADWVSVFATASAGFRAHPRADLLPPARARHQPATVRRLLSDQHRRSAGAPGRRPPTDAPPSPTCDRPPHRAYRAHMRVHQPTSTAHGARHDGVGQRDRHRGRQPTPEPFSTALGVIDRARHRVAVARERPAKRAGTLGHIEKSTPPVREPPGMRDHPRRPGTELPKHDQRLPSQGELSGRTRRAVDPGSSPLLPHWPVRQHTQGYSDRPQQLRHRHTDLLRRLPIPGNGRPAHRRSRRRPRVEHHHHHEYPRLRRTRGSGPHQI
jgi:Peptidase family M48